MRTNYPKSLLSLTIVHILLQSGFQRISQHALTILTDLLVYFIERKILFYKLEGEFKYFLNPKFIIEMFTYREKNEIIGYLNSRRRNEGQVKIKVQERPMISHLIDLDEATDSVPKIKNKIKQFNPNLEKLTNEQVTKEAYVNKTDNRVTNITDASDQNTLSTSEISLKETNLKKKASDLKQDENINDNEAKIYHSSFKYGEVPSEKELLKQFIHDSLQIIPKKPKKIKNFFNVTFTDEQIERFNTERPFKFGAGPNRLFSTPKEYKQLQDWRKNEQWNPNLGNETIITDELRFMAKWTVEKE